MELANRINRKLKMTQKILKLHMLLLMAIASTAEKRAIRKQIVTH